VNCGISRCGIPVFITYRVPVAVCLCRPMMHQSATISRAPPLSTGPRDPRAADCLQNGRLQQNKRVKMATCNRTRVSKWPPATEQACQNGHLQQNKRVKMATCNRTSVSKWPPATEQACQNGHLQQDMRVKKLLQM